MHFFGDRLFYPRYDHRAMATILHVILPSNPEAPPYVIINAQCTIDSMYTRLYLYRDTLQEKSIDFVYKYMHTTLPSKSRSLKSLLKKLNMNVILLNDELKRVQKVLESNNNGIHTIVCPKFIQINNPSPDSIIKTIACQDSTEENIAYKDWQMIVTKATGITKKLRGKAIRNEGDIVSGRMISIRNGQGIGIAISKKNITREELRELGNPKSGFTFSFVLPTHSQKKMPMKKDKKKHRINSAITKQHAAVMA